MPASVVVLIVVVAGALLFALAWWSSGRSKGLGRRNADGDAQQGRAYFEANVSKFSRGDDSGGGYNF